DRRSRSAARARGSPPSYRLRLAGRGHVGRGDGPRGAGSPGANVRLVEGRSARTRGGGARGLRPHGVRRPQMQDLLGRPATAGRHRARRHPFAEGPVPGRADHGLDPQSRARMWDEIRRLRSEGMTVFITTHYLEEADALCDRIAIIDHGEIVAEGTPQALKREISGDVVSVTLASSAELHETESRLGTAAEVLRCEPYVRSLELHDAGIRLFVESGATAIPHIARALDQKGIVLDSIEIHRPSLDDVFLAKTGRSLRES